MAVLIKNRYMLVSKVKYNAKKAHWTFEAKGDPRDGDCSEWKSGVMVGEAKAELVDALGKFAELTCTLLGMPDLYDKALDNLRATGVSISYQSDALLPNGLNRGLVVTALRDVENHDCPWVINTPIMWESPITEGSAGKLLPGIASTLMDRLVECAEAYLNGDYATEQLSLMNVVEATPLNFAAVAERSQPQEVFNDLSDKAVYPVLSKAKALYKTTFGKPWPGIQPHLTRPPTQTI